MYFQFFDQLNVSLLNISIHLKQYNTLTDLKQLIGSVLVCKFVWWDTKDTLEKQLHS